MTSNLPLAQAMPALLLDGRFRVLGPDHPNTLTTRNNLASWRDQTEDDTVVPLTNVCRT